MNPNMRQVTKNFTTYVRPFRIYSKSAKALTTQPHLTEKVWKKNACLTINAKKNASIIRKGLVRGEGGHREYPGISLLRTCLRQHLHHPPSHERLSTPRGLRPLQSTGSIHQTAGILFITYSPSNKSQSRSHQFNSIPTTYYRKKKIDSNWTLTVSSTFSFCFSWK